MNLLIDCNSDENLDNNYIFNNEELNLVDVNALSTNYQNYALYAF